CRTQADIAFLLDGSGSVRPDDFSRMKTFVKNLIKSFLGRDVKFAITQFSSRTTTHFYFNQFNIYSNWQNQIDQIRQLTGGTKTAEAIRNVVEDVFSPLRGSRANVNKILIVITDGESQDGSNLPGTIKLADDKKIVRFAIGVGSAFTNPRAKQELDTIASKPAGNFVFQVGSFDALNKIQESLQAKIFSIEGSQTSGEALKQEMSQEGFRAAYVSGEIQMAMVGANQWKGGYKKYSLSSAQTTGSFEPSFLEADSYLDKRQKQSSAGRPGGRPEQAQSSGGRWRRPGEPSEAEAEPGKPSEAEAKPGEPSEA
ncbi:hypothetical protein AMECASPLE_037622, partial [Ameca splendens]